MPLEDSGSYEIIKKTNLPNIRFYYSAGAVLFIIVLLMNFYVEEINIRLNNYFSLRNLQTILLVSLIILVILEILVIFIPLERKIKQREASLIKQIEDRRLAEAKLRKTEYTYKLLATNLPNLSFLLFDKDMRFILADGPFLERSGFNKEKVEGKLLSEVIVGDKYPEFYQYYKSALEGNSSFFEGYSDVGYYYHTHIVPTYDRQGEITGGMAVTEDISDSHKINIELKEAQNRFNELAENLQSGFWLSSPDGNEIFYMNKSVAKIYGGSLNDLYKNPQSFKDNIHPDDIELTQKNRLDRISNNEYNIEFRLQINNSIKWVWSRAFPVKNDKGETIRVAGIIEDITERKLLEQKAIQFEIDQKTIKLLSGFIRDTAHDLRTPLTIINTSSYLISKINSREDQLKHIDIINRQVARLTIIIDQLHSMSNIDAMNYLYTKPIKINHIIKNIKNNLTYKAKQKNISVNYSSLEGNYIINGDEDYLFKAINSICDNAIIYTEENGEVNISTYKNENNLIIEIQDNGIGISESDLDKIFERFYKVNKARTSNTSSTGLGLTMAKLIIEKHKGKITVNSKLGEGSTFKISLPIETSNK